MPLPASLVEKEHKCLQDLIYIYICILYTIYTLYTIYYIVYSIYYILYILYTIYYILYTLYYILYTIYYYILYTIYTLYTVHILYIYILYIYIYIDCNRCTTSRNLTSIEKLHTHRLTRKTTWKCTQANTNKHAHQSSYVT